MAAAVAATPEMPMFAPAPAAGWEASRSVAGSRMLPSTEPDDAARERDGEAPGAECVSSSGSKAAAVSHGGGRLLPGHD